MAISVSADVLTTALWPQGDMRDPLGVWGFRLGITGDNTGGSTKVQVTVPPGLSAAYIYTCYSLNVAQLTGAPSAAEVQARLLTSWPNVDVQIVGVQGYATLIVRNMLGDTNFTAPLSGANNAFVQELDRYLLLFDPRPTPLGLPIAELEVAVNIDPSTWSFEGYGYYWDRSVLNAPGGLRHPGSS